LSTYNGRYLYKSDKNQPRQIHRIFIFNGKIIMAKSNCERINELNTALDEIERKTNEVEEKK